MRFNNWQKISEEYWMCFLYDVWLCHGVWMLSFYLGPRFKKTFKTAKIAMQYADNLKEELV